MFVNKRNVLCFCTLYHITQIAYQKALWWTKFNKATYVAMYLCTYVHSMKIIYANGRQKWIANYV